MTSKSERALLQLLDDGEMELRPNLTKLSRRTGLPISTLFDAWQKIKARGDVSVFAIIAREKRIVEHRTVRQRFDSSKRFLHRAHFVHDEGALSAEDV